MKLALIKDGVVKAIVPTEDKEAYIAKIAELENPIEVVEIPEGNKVYVLDTYAKGKFTATGEFAKILAEKAEKNKKEEKPTNEEKSSNFKELIAKRTPEDFGK